MWLSEGWVLREVPSRPGLFKLIEIKKEFLFKFLGLRKTKLFFHFDRLSMTITPKITHSIYGPYQIDEGLRKLQLCAKQNGQKGGAQLEGLT